MKFERDINKMGMIGAADYVVVLSDPDTCLVRVASRYNFGYGAYIQVIHTEYIYELYYTHMEYPVNPKVVAVGDKASRELGRFKHDKVLLNEWRAM